MASKPKQQKPHGDVDKELIFVGRYRCGWRPIQLFGDPRKYGGSFSHFPGDPTDEVMSNIVVGFQDTDYCDVHNILLHEICEMTLSDQLVRYKKTDLFQPYASDAFVFHFNHNQFTEAMAQTSLTLLLCEKDLKKAWKKHRRELRKNARS